MNLLGGLRADRDFSLNQRLSEAQGEPATHFPSPCCKRRSPRRIQLKHGNDNPSAAFCAATPHTPEK
jgi:hypothetical protein